MTKSRIPRLCKTSLAEGSGAPAEDHHHKLKAGGSKQQRTILDFPSEIITHIVHYLDNGHHLRLLSLHGPYWCSSQDEEQYEHLYIPSTALLALSWSCKLLHSYARPLLCKYSSDVRKFCDLSVSGRARMQVVSAQDRQQLNVRDYFAEEAYQDGARNPMVQDLLGMEKWPAYDPLGMSETLLGWSCKTGEQEAMLERFGWKTRHLNIFACTKCLRLRQIDKFVVSQVTGRRGKRAKSSKASHEAHERFCIDCGIKDVRCYNKGKLYRYFEKDLNEKPNFGMVCRRCEQWKICSEGRDGKEAANKMCQECLVYRPRGRTPGAEDDGLDDNDREDT